MEIFSLGEAHARTMFQRAWMYVVDHDSRGVPSGHGSIRSLHLEGPQVWLGVLPGTIHQWQPGQEQEGLLIRRATKMTNLDTHGIDTICGQLSM